MVRKLIADADGEPVPEFWLAEQGPRWPRSAATMGRLFFPRAASTPWVFPLPDYPNSRAMADATAAREPARRPACNGSGPGRAWSGAGR